MLRWFVIGPASPDIIRELGFSISLIFSGWILIFGELAWLAHLIENSKYSKPLKIINYSYYYYYLYHYTKCLQAEKATSSPALKSQDCATAGFSLPEKNIHITHTCCRQALFI